MHVFFQWLALAIVATLLTDLFAHRDELAVRRFRELSGDTVAGELDKSRNARWHKLGAWHRLAVALVLAAAAGGWFGLRYAGPALLTAGSLSALWFDVFLNRRLNLPWDYAGTTSTVDALLKKRGATRRMAAVELAGVLAGLAWWLLARQIALHL